MTNGRIIGLISGKGGVGKTSLTVNLGISLRQFGNEVTLIDADFDASNLGVYLGRYEHPVKMQQVLKGENVPEKAIFRHPTGIKVASSSNEINEVSPSTDNLREILLHAAEDSDYVLVDCPPGLNPMVESIMSACDELMIVTMPTQTASTNAAQIIHKAKQLHKPVLGTIVNKVDGNPEIELIDKEVEMMTETHIIGEIPYDQKMKSSLFENQPLVNYDPLAEASIGIKQIAADMDGQSYERPKFAPIKRKLNKFKDIF